MIYSPSKEVKNVQQSILKLEPFQGQIGGESYRTIIKTRHGRTLFLSVTVSGDQCTVTDCFYTDRNQGKREALRYSAKPKKLQSSQFPTKDLLTVIETELDKKFYGVEFVPSDQAELPLDEYLRCKAESANRKYRFLIMVGDGERHGSLPARLRTRLKNRLHRSIYVELAYYKDGNGVVRQCCYYDRAYKRQDIQITPPQLISCFFPYTPEGIVNLLNHEIWCDFTHIIVTDGIDLDSNTTPLCGAI
jgi:hypothetical protein